MSQANAQPCHLLRLSPELRNIIFELGLAQDRIITVHLWRPCSKNIDRNLEAHPMALTMTCKQLRQEALSLFLANNRFKVSLDHQLTRHMIARWGRESIPLNKRYECALQDTQRWLDSLGADAQHIPALGIFFGRYDRYLGALGLGRFKQLQRPGLELELTLSFGSERTTMHEFFRINFNQAGQNETLGDIRWKAARAGMEVLLSANTRSHMRQITVTTALRDIFFAKNEAERVVRLLEAWSGWSWGSAAVSQSTAASASTSAPPTASQPDDSAIDPALLFSH